MSRRPYRNVSPGPKAPDEGSVNPYDRIRGNIFPAARQGEPITASAYMADTGLERIPMSRRSRPENAGRDTLQDVKPGTAANAQWSSAYGMTGAEKEIRVRYMQTINFGKLISPRVGAMMDGRSDMRPSAIAVPVRAFGKPPVSGPGGRMVAPGRVTRWQQASMIWPNMGKGN